MNAKKITIIIIILIIIVAGVYLVFRNSQKGGKPAEANPSPSETPAPTPAVNEIQGMKIDILKQGTGPATAKNGDVVTVDYTGTFENGAKFDSSIDRGVPFSFTLGEGKVIRGWDLGVLGMKIGEKRKLTIPSDLAYGSSGVPGAIPPNAVLIFEVELLKIGQ